MNAGLLRPAAAYVRVSTDDQSVEMQRTEIKAAALVRGYEIVEWFEETASAKTTTRPVLKELRVQVRARQWHTVFTFKLDRLCRSGILDAFTLVDEFRRAGCQLLSLRDPFDLGGPAADILLAVFAWVAQEERKNISMRVRASFAHIRSSGKTKSGKPIGRPRREIDLGRVHDLRVAGRSWRSIAQALKVPAPTVRRAYRVSHDAKLK